VRAVVFGYSEVGYRCLEVLLEAGVEIPLVLTHEDDPGEERWFRSVADLAARASIPTFTPNQVNAPAWVERVREARPDCIFSFYYRKLLSREMLDVAATGAFNMHGSLLPAYRGRCPVNWVLVHGETRTGVTLHEMVEQPDAGDIVGRRIVEIEASDDALSLSNRIAGEAAVLLRDLLPALGTEQLERTPQRLDEGSYYGGRGPEDGRIDWNRPALEIHNLVRAVTRPWPGAFTEFAGQRLFVWESSVDPGPRTAPPGTVAQGPCPVVACGEGGLILRRWQLDGEKDRDINEKWESANPIAGKRLG
jgi:methionyl-tRNA formyltransferase